jgi:hypothetical protein
MLLHGLLYSHRLIFRVLLNCSTVPTGPMMWYRASEGGVFELVDGVVLLWVTSKAFGAKMCPSLMVPERGVLPDLWTRCALRQANTIPTNKT